MNETTVSTSATTIRMSEAESTMSENTTTPCHWHLDRKGDEWIPECEGASGNRWLVIDGEPPKACPYCDKPVEVTDTTDETDAVEIID